jgi:hypothetical protein
MYGTKQLLVVERTMSAPSPVFSVRLSLAAAPRHARRVVAAVVFAAVSLGGAPANAANAPEVTVLAVGANHSFKKTLGELKFAELDAERFARAMTSVGLVPTARATVLTGGDTEDFRRVLRELAKAGASEADGGRKFVFYFSGHADDQGIHFPDGPIGKAELHELLTAVKAHTKVAIVDSCFSGGISAKGIERAAAFELPRMEYDEPSGSVFLSAASARQFAYESEQLESSVFTHHLLAGLYGEADGNADGVVTIDELYQYVYRNTKWQTLSYPTAASQEPEIIARLQGQGAVVLSFPSQTNAKLALEPPMDGEVTIAALGGLQYFRVQKAPGLEKILQLPAGRYRVSLRRADKLGDGEVALAPAKVTLLSTADLKWRDAPLPTAATKGEMGPMTAASAYQPPDAPRWHFALGAHQGFEPSGPAGPLVELGYFLPVGNHRWRSDLGVIGSFHRHERERTNGSGWTNEPTQRTDSTALYGVVNPGARAGGLDLSILGGFGQTYHDQRIILEDGTKEYANGAAAPGWILGVGVAWASAGTRYGLALRDETVEVARVATRGETRAHGSSAVFTVAF